MTTSRLEGRIAIVTGAGCVGTGWGNGRAVAVQLAREGARVLATDIDTGSLEETVAMAGAAGGNIEAFFCDVTDEASIRTALSHCETVLGAPDILVNNVGGSAPGGAAELSREAWDRQILFNLTSVFLTCKAVLPGMQARQRGAIVNLASTSGLRYTGAAQAGYAAAKAAVIQFSKVTAVQYAPYGIRVNTVVPGQLHTPMVENRLAGQRAGGNVEALLESRVKRIPLGFMGDGRDTAQAVAYLASDDARFVTGTEIVLDGGMTARCD
ncbi:SDR family NAD(P)-dependent oxidoreductase [Pelagibacterium halotolerans]|uniref:3-oxoacyl-(Acyl-carrier protein) reductase n=1 Tax=Pelagibacterium halotolerans (strain DSM 22347 / JCM 15775 / CGMCC 1.7692 / B2) TaxID=1082931 RepID=G4R8D2_PELHB|nr:SDR family NAD(P)-dependent oxidoreductase [Pelagibacterium halotolerans]AEQ52376.1 3-oxoacyl-(acyl-carrier protein) reductase [Pelagibacterium halotolerans B2]QJR17885.1 SDR family oxidoreductase [Pelagibacterium halotolerans]SEA34715.1 NAD(P)-dependent dehydrogenase, short-chain alcohol dehydrogenase family [Pelagibacterium halotolerans]